MNGKVSVDTEKLQNIKKHIIEFDHSISAFVPQLISYLRTTKDVIEAKIQLALNEFENREEKRKEAERIANPEQLEILQNQHSLERQAEEDLLNEQKTILLKFSSLADEIKSHLLLLTGHYHEQVDKGTSLLSKCILAIDKYTSSVLNSYDSLNNCKSSGLSNYRDPRIEIKEASNRWVEILSKEEKDAIFDYTKEIPPYYKNINRVLRGIENTFDYGNQERYDLIHSALQKACTPCDMVLFRGCASDALGDLQFLSDEEIIDRVYIDKGFVSTSMNRRASFFGDILIIIHLPEGSRAANIESLSAAGHYEEEVLIDINTFFRITNAYKNDDGRRVIEVNATT